MKKLVSLALLFTTVNLANAQNKPYITCGHVINSDSIVIAHFYIAADTGQMYWGCNDSIIPYVLNTDLYQLKSDKGEIVTAIPVQTKQDQNNLTIVFTEFLREKHLSAKDSFIAIFNFYRLAKWHPNWTELFFSEW